MFGSQKDGIKDKPLSAGGEGWVGVPAERVPRQEEMVGKRQRNKPTGIRKM